MKNRKIIILNLGSTSFKFKLYQIVKDKAEEEQCLEIVQGQTENVGDHLEAFEDCLKELEQSGILLSMGELDAVGYKSVHAGAISGARIIDGEILTVMEHYSDYAPAHNPVYIRLMRQVREKWPGLLQIGCFETSFHADIPLKRAVYGVPDDWREQLGIRKYGFHGASHSYIAWRMSREDRTAPKVISVHLGGSSSLCAIENGKSIASSMGATPQSGLFQNNRVGDFDIFCLPALMKYYGGDFRKILDVLSRESGLLGLSGVSNDLRQVLLAAENGNQRAQLAIDAFVDNIAGYIGMFQTYLKGLDCLVFTGGIGFNSNYIRSRVCQEISFLGISLDMEKNLSGREGKISIEESRIGVYVFKTDEELMVMHQCLKILDEKKQEIKGLEKGKIM